MDTLAEELASDLDTTDGTNDLEEWIEEELLVEEISIDGMCGVY